MPETDLKWVSSQLLTQVAGLYMTKHSALLLSVLTLAACPSPTNRVYSKGLFASTLRQQVGTDVLQCPWGADPEGNCNQKNSTWVDATAWDVLPLTAATDANDETVAKTGITQYAFMSVVDEKPLRLGSKCDAVTLDTTPLAPVFASLTVYDRLSSDIREQVRIELESKIKTPELRTRALAEFETKLNQRFDEKKRAGTESNGLLVESRLLTEPRKLKKEIRDGCLLEGSRVVTGISGFIVLKSTSASETDLAQSIAASIDAAISAVAEIPTDEKNSILKTSAKFSAGVAQTIVRSSGFTLKVDQKKFFPVWGEVKRVVCEEVVSRSTSTVLSAVLSDNMKVSGAWRAQYSCSKGTAQEISDDGFTCTSTTAVEIEARMKLCRLQSVTNGTR